MRFPSSIVFACIVSAASQLRAQEKITYQQQVRPIFNANCITRCAFALVICPKPDEAFTVVPGEFQVG